MLTPVVQWELLTFRSIGSADEKINPLTSLPDNWAWTVLPKVEFLHVDALSTKLTAAPVAEEVVAHGHNLEKAAYYYIHLSLSETAGLDRSKLPYHLTQFLKWADRNMVANPAVHSETEPTELIERVRTYNAQGELLHVIGESLVPSCGRRSSRSS